MSNPKYDVWCEACGCQMKLRKGKNGQFWGCTGFPTCRNTISVRDAALNHIAPDRNHNDHWRD